MIIGDHGGDFIIDRLNDYGYKAYYVGGCVRDSLLGLQVSDYDITTDCLPEKLIAIFNDKKILTVGIKHGTISILINEKIYEVTTFRKESVYLDNRHPESVEFCDDLQCDLSRRDFCCNAIAYNKKQGIIDYFNGFYDLKNRVIRAVGEPNQRFNEDALRILRALRFCSKLKFDLDVNTKLALCANYKLLKNISSERIFYELKGILMGENSQAILTEFRDVFKYLLPPLSKMAESDYNWSALLVSKGQSLLVKLVCLFYNVDILDIKDVLKNLKCDNTTMNDVLRLSKFKDFAIANTADIKFLMREFDGGLDYLLELKRAVCIAKDDNAGILWLEWVKKQYHQILKNGECFSLKQLAIKGDDVAKYCKREDISKYLTLLLNAVIEDKIKNNRDDLISFLLKLL